jgi:hypothetical protein
VLNDLDMAAPETLLHQVRFQGAGDSQETR